MSTNSDLFDQNVPIKLQKALLRLVFAGCKTASDHCYGTFRSNVVAKDVSGVYRRGVIEDQWEGIPALFPKQVSVDPRWYKHYTGSYYELTCGVVKLTQSCVLFRGDIPRQAEFRATLATNGQGELFEPQPDEDANTEPHHLYAILTYGIDAKAEKRGQPWFIKIEIPNAECTASVDEGIDLIKRYPDIAQLYLSKPSFEAAVRERPKRKRKTA